MKPLDPVAWGPDQSDLSVPGHPGRGGTGDITVFIGTVERFVVAWP